MIEIFKTNYTNIFIGGNHLKASPYWTPSFKGNSILVNVKSNIYIYT